MIRDEYYEFMIKEHKKMNNLRSKFKNVHSDAWFHVIRDSKMYIS